MTEPSIRRLSDVAKHLIYPPAIALTGWPDVSDACSRDLGIEFDAWQESAGNLILGKHPDGALAATVGGVGMSLPRQIGKALDVDTELLTANRGWTTMGQVRVGDVVFHPSGRPVAVTFTSNIIVGNDCFEVVTTDRRRIVADADHLWTVLDKGAARKWRTLTTRELYREDLMCNGTRERRFVLPRQDAIDLPAQDLPIDPYLFGAWLGDGGHTGGNLWSGCRDVNHWIDAVRDAGFIPKPKLTGSAWRIGVTCERGAGRQSRSFVGKLRKLGVLGNKHIPDVYLLSSTDQRFALLQGLLDTDGYCGPGGTVCFWSTLPELADGVAFLARSLGWRTSVMEKKVASGRWQGNRYFRVTFTPKLADGPAPFRISRKAARVGVADGGAGRKTVTIQEISPVATRPVRCIKVASEDGLFLAGRDLIPTHNTYLLCGLIFGLCLNQPGLLVIWTSHHQRTHGETFLWMLAFTERERVAPHISRVYLGSGDEEIKFRNGSRILFGARERGFGRGIAGVDCLVFDEAQILSERALQNMLATLNTSQLGLHIYCGTPPRPEDNSEAFRRMREDALSGDTTDLVWIECGAPDDADIDDKQTWAQANISVGIRTPLSSMERLRRKLDPDGFRREGLGMWDPIETSALDLARWGRLADEHAPQPERVTLTIDASPDRQWASIGAAGEIGDGRTLVACWTEPGLQWVVPKIIELRKARDVAEISIHIGGQATALQPDLNRADIEYVKMSASDMGAACACLLKAVRARTIVHWGQDELDAAVANAQTRKVGEGERWDRRDSRVDISALVACSGALWRFGMLEAPLPAIY